MTKYICDRASDCRHKEDCGGAQPHGFAADECDHCPMDPDARCVEIEDETSHDRP